MIYFDLFKFLIENIILITTLLVIMAVIIAAFYDLKYNIIPNKLTFSLISFGLIINLIYSILFRDFLFIINSIITTIIVFSVCYLLWKFRLWGGGDVKLITGIASTLPFHPAILNQYINNLNLHSLYTHIFSFPIIAIYPFPLTVILNSILVSFPFLIGFILINYITNVFDNNFKFFLNSIISKVKSKFRIFRKDFSIKYLFIFIEKISISLALSILTFLIFKSNGLSQIKTLESIILILLFGVMITISSIIFKYFISNFRKISKNGTKSYVNSSDLKEGMIIEDVLIEKSKIDHEIPKEKKKNKKKFLKWILVDVGCIEEIAEYNIHIKEDNGEYLLRSKTAAGLNKNDLMFLNRLVKKDIIASLFEIKIGIPFAPSIAIGFIFSIFIGDISTIGYKCINFFII
jgi:archaeal preflagellin peptidase FlaK